MGQAAFRVREATLADANGIARVHVDSWRTTYAGIVPADYLAGLSYERSASRMAEKLAAVGPPECVLVAVEDGGQVVGFAHGGPNGEGSGEYEGAIYGIYLLQAYQRRGIGRALVAAVAGRLLAVGMRSLILSVLAQNPACGFYERLEGKVRVGEREALIGGARLKVVSYGWPDIRALIES